MLNKLAMTFIGIAIMTLLLVHNSQSCQMLEAFIFSNFVAIPLMGILSIFLTVRAFQANNEQKGLSILLAVVLLFVCALLFSYSVMIGIGLGHGGCTGPGSSANEEYDISPKKLEPLI